MSTADPAAPASRSRPSMRGMTRSLTMMAGRKLVTFRGPSSPSDASSVWKPQACTSSARPESGSRDRLRQSARVHPAPRQRRSYSSTCRWFVHCVKKVYHPLGKFYIVLSDYVLFASLFQRGLLQLQSVSGRRRQPGFSRAGGSSPGTPGVSPGRSGWALSQRWCSARASPPRSFSSPP